MWTSVANFCRWECLVFDTLAQQQWLSWDSSDRITAWAQESHENHLIRTRATKTRDFPYFSESRIGRQQHGLILCHMWHMLNPMSYTPFYIFPLLTQVIRKVKLVKWSIVNLWKLFFVADVCVYMWNRVSLSPDTLSCFIVLAPLLLLGPLPALVTYQQSSSLIRLHGCDILISVATPLWIMFVGVRKLPSSCCWPAVVLYTIANAITSVINPLLSPGLFCRGHRVVHED